MAHSGGHSKGHLGGVLAKVLLAALSGAGDSSAGGAASAGAEGDVGGAIGDGDTVASTTDALGGMSGGNTRMGGGRPVMAKPPSMPLDTPVSTNGSYTPQPSAPVLSKPGFFARLANPNVTSTYLQAQAQLANTALQGQQAMTLQQSQQDFENNRDTAKALIQQNSDFRNNIIAQGASKGVAVGTPEQQADFAARMYDGDTLNAVAAQHLKGIQLATGQSVADTQLATANSDAGRQTVKTGFEAEQLKPFGDLLAKAPVTGVGQNIDANFPGLGSFTQRGAIPAGTTTSSKKVGPNGQVFENNITTTSPPYKAGGGGFTQPLQDDVEGFQQSQQPTATPPIQVNPNQGNFNFPIPNVQPGIGGSGTNILAKPPIATDNGFSGIGQPFQAPQNQIQVQQMIQQLQQMTSPQGYNGLRDVNGYPISRPPSPFWDSIDFGQ